MRSENIYRPFQICYFYCLILLLLLIKILQMEGKPAYSCSNTKSTLYVLCVYSSKTYPCRDIHSVCQSLRTISHIAFMDIS